jgi:hypothetical protein
MRQSDQFQKGGRKEIQGKAAVYRQKLAGKKRVVKVKAKVVEERAETAAKRAPKVGTISWLYCKSYAIVLKKQNACKNKRQK